MRARKRRYKHRFIPSTLDDLLPHFLSVNSGEFLYHQGVTYLGQVSPCHRPQDGQAICFHGDEQVSDWGNISPARQHQRIALSRYKWRFSVPRKHWLYVKQRMVVWAWSFERHNLTVTHSYLMGRCSKCNRVFWAYQGAEYKRG